MSFYTESKDKALIVSLIKPVAYLSNSYRTGRIVVSDANLNKQRITGVLSLANPDETLHILSNTLALQESSLGSWWVVLHR